MVFVDRKKCKISTIKILLYIVISLFLFVSCSKDVTEPKPFQLYVDNKTDYNYKIFVNGEYKETVDSLTKKSIGSFDGAVSNHLQAKTGGFTDFDASIDEVNGSTYTWTLELSSFTLCIDNKTNEDVAIYVAYTYAGICDQGEKHCMGEFPQAETSLLEAYGPYPPGHYWRKIMRTIGKDKVEWSLNIN